MGFSTVSLDVQRSYEFLKYNINMTRILLIATFFISQISCTTATFIDSVFDGSYFDSPSVKNGEFPFTLIYMNFNKKHILTDSIVCEFDGKIVDTGSARNKWKKSYLSGREELILKTIKKNQYIYFSDSSCQYYMGDLPSYVTHKSEMGSLVISTTNDNSISNSIVTKDMAKNNYGIEVLEWLPSKPISQISRKDHE